MAAAAKVTSPPVPLQKPGGWTGDAERFARAVVQALEDLYRRWGRIGVADLDAETRRQIVQAVTADGFESAFRQTATALDVRFGPIGELNNPTMKVTSDVFYVRVRRLVFELMDELGDVRMQLLSDGTGGFQKLYAREIRLNGADLDARLTGIEARLTALETAVSALTTTTP